MGVIAIRGVRRSRVNKIEAGDVLKRVHRIPKDFIGFQIKGDWM
jgi:hypothetical protein